jgi:DNA-binding LacI/PurR family transcriptional regulator
MKQRSTREDVATKAGVSKTTVTYVLGDRYDVAITEPTRSRVRQAAAQLGYRPHAAARALASGRTNSITVAFPERIGAHYAHVLQAFEAHTNAQGYHMVASTIGHIKVDNALPDLFELLGNLTDGVILVDMPHDFIPDIDEMLPDIKPIVSMGVFTNPKLDCVEVNIGDATKMALDHLLGTSGKSARIAFFGPHSPEGDITVTNKAYEGDPRFTTYHKAMSSTGRPLEFIEGFPSNRHASLNAINRHIADHGCPDSIFCFNDEIAISALRALREAGRRVPEDVIVVGCDGSEEGEYACPSLSTIVQPIETMCDNAWKLMMDRLKNSNAPRKHVTVEANFVIRDSSKRRIGPL